MYENKNTQQLTTGERLRVGVGAVMVGALAIGGVTSANEIGSVDTSFASSELPSHDQSASPATIHLEPATLSVSSSEQTAIQTPSFKGKVTIKKRSQQNEINAIDSPAPLPPITPMVVLPENNPAPKALLELNLDKAHLTENDYKYVSKNTVFLDFKDGYCSGSLIRDTNDVAIGVRTAEHCYLQDDSTTPRIQGSDGKTYIVKPSGVKVEIGSFKPVFKTIGNINEFYLPNSDDRSMDLAIGAFEGHNMDDVLAAFKSTMLTDEAINSLKTGTKATLSGYPYLQKNNPNPNYLRRQDFPMIVLGVTKAVKTNKDNASHDWSEDILWTAVPLSKGGSTCSFGNSGGEGTVVIDGKRMSLGILSRFLPFNSDYNNDSYQQTEEGAKSSKEAFEKAFGVDLTGVAAICGFSNKIPDSNNVGTTVEVVSSYSEVPIQHQSFKQEVPAFAEPLIQKAHDEFFDPNYAKTWVRGAINLDPNGKGYWKMNPVIFYDKESGSAIIGSYTDNAKDGLELDFIPDFKNQKFYGYPELFNTDGELTTFNGMYGYNGFTGKGDGYIFGQTLEDKNAIEYVQNDPQFSLYFDDSTQSLQIMQYKHN